MVGLCGITYLIFVNWFNLVYEMTSFMLIFILIFIDIDHHIHAN